MIIIYLTTIVIKKTQNQLSGFISSTWKTLNIFEFSCRQSSVIFAYSAGAFSIIDVIRSYFSLLPEPYTNFRTPRAALRLASLSAVNMVLNSSVNVFILVNNLNLIFSLRGGQARKKSVTNPCN